MVISSWKTNIWISESLQGPGPVNVTLLSSGRSWCGGKGVFEYIDDPLTDEEYLRKVVRDKDMRRKLFDIMYNEMSSNKPSDGQTSDSFGKTGPGKFFIIINLLAISRSIECPWVNYLCAV